MFEPKVIGGHPAVELYNRAEQPVLITVCASCEKQRTVLFLTGDRWMCTSCRAEGNTPPNLYPVS